MPEGETLVTTGVDLLIDTVKKKKRVSFEQAAKLLKVDIKTIEAWASFLEEEDAVIIDYKFTTPYLVDKSVSPTLGPKSDDIEFIQIDSLIDDAGKAMNQNHIEEAKEKFSTALSHIQKIHEEVKDVALKKEPEVHSFIQDRIDELDDNLKKVENYITKGKREEAKEVLKNMHTTSKISSSQMKNLRHKVGTISKKRVEDIPDINDGDDTDLAKAEADLTQNTKSSDASVLSDEPSFISSMTKLPDMTLLKNDPNLHLRRAYEHIQGGKFDEAKKIYSDLQTFLSKMPEDYLLKKRELNNDLIKLNRDLEINYERRFSLQVSNTTKEVNRRFLRIQNLLQGLNVKDAETEISETEKIIESIPEGFLKVKTQLQTRLLELDQNLIRTREIEYSKEFQKKSFDIMDRLTKSYNALKVKNASLAETNYKEAKEIFKGLPEGFTKQKVLLQNRIMDIYKGVLIANAELEENKETQLTVSIKGSIDKVVSLINQNKILEAEKLYHETKNQVLSSNITSLPQKTKIENMLLGLHEQIIKKKETMLTVEMENKSQKVLSLIDISLGYLNKKQFDLAEEAIGELSNIYSTLPDSFFEKKIELHTKILDLTKRLIIESDQGALGDTDINIKKRYDVLLKLIVTYHEHVHMKEFTLLETTFEHIFARYNELPVGFVSKNTRIRDEIQKIQSQIEILKMIRTLDQEIKNKNSKNVQDIINSIKSSVSSQLRISPQDSALFDYIIKSVQGFEGYLDPSKRVALQNNQNNIQTVTNQTKQNTDSISKASALMKKEILETISAGDYVKARDKLQALAKIDSDAAWITKISNYLKDMEKKKKHSSKK